VSISTVFIDLDDTLYPASSGVWELIKERIGLFMLEELKIPAELIQPLRRQYYEQYGTALRGLQNNYKIDSDKFLAFVHDVPISDYLKPDPTLISVLRNLKTRKFIFTNSDINHTKRVLRVLQLENYFDGIIDVKALDPYCKPMPQAFKIALQLAGETDPARCVMIDDIRRTTKTAREQGFFTILFGEEEPLADADEVLSDWASLPDLLNR